MSRFGVRFSSEDWFKPSHSSNAHACVEVALMSAATGVRDSKDQGGSTLVFEPQHWQSFIASLKQ